MDNHLHLLVRLDTAEAATWSEEDVVRRWFRLYPPRGADRKPLAVAQVNELMNQRLKDEKWVAKSRERQDRWEFITWRTSAAARPFSSS